MVENNIQEQILEIKKTKTLADKKTICKNSKKTIPQQSLTSYLKSLSTLLKTSKKVTVHTILQSEKWTKSCYDLLSKKITEDLIRNLSSKARVEMGASLSSKTLQKIVTLTYKAAYPIDPRTLNTLNKIVIFLEYKNWDDFITSTDKKQLETSSLEVVTQEELVKNVVKEAIRHEYLTYCYLPEVKEEILHKNFITNSSCYNMIMDALLDKSSKKQTISNNYNPSTYEILEIEIKKIEADNAQVFTKEYWLLCWWDTLQKRYVKRFKVITDHFYILHKENNIWKIKTNASTSDPMELE